MNWVVRRCGGAAYREVVEEGAEPQLFTDNYRMKVEDVSAMVAEFVAQHESETEQGEKWRASMQRLIATKASETSKQISALEKKLEAVLTHTWSVTA